MGHSGVLNATRTLPFSPDSESGVSSTLWWQGCLLKIAWPLLLHIQVTSPPMGTSKLNPACAFIFYCTPPHLLSFLFSSLISFLPIPLLFHLSSLSLICLVRCKVIQGWRNRFLPLVLNCWTWIFVLRRTVFFSYAKGTKTLLYCAYLHACLSALLRS